MIAATAFFVFHSLVGTGTTRHTVRSWPDHGGAAWTGLTGTGRTYFESLRVAGTRNASQSPPRSTGGHIPMSQVDERSANHRGSLDQALSALSETARRRVLLAITEDSPRQQETFETGKFAPASPDRETTRMELYHQHLPRLDETGYIDWEEDTGRVGRGADFDEIRPLLDLLDDHPDKLPASWP